MIATNHGALTRAGRIFVAWAAMSRACASSVDRVASDKPMMSPAMMVMRIEIPLFLFDRVLALVTVIGDVATPGALSGAPRA